MQEFFTREVANEGKRVPLFLPTGETTDHWIHIVGVDSDIFRAAEARSQRKAIELVGLDTDQDKAEMARTLQLESVASLITAWSFDQECNLTNKVAFLRNAPQIADMVNRLAANRKYFFKKGSDSSANG